MNDPNAFSELISLLNQANAREMQVSIQYMLQHSIWFAKHIDKKSLDSKTKFFSSHSPIWLPGSGLRKIAMAEMIHAEIIAERIVELGGELLSQPDPISVGQSVMEMLEIDIAEEQSAIQLYEKIIDLAREVDDKKTLTMFSKILLDEKRHHQTFTTLKQQS